MGRLIDADEVIKDMQYYHDDCAKTSEYTRLGFETAIEVTKDAPTVEAIPKDQYENRLKADMVAMLTEIQLEIEEMDSNHTMPDVWCNQASKEIWNTALKLIEEIIEVRINNLKGMTKDGERPNE